MSSLTPIDTSIDSEPGVMQTDDNSTERNTFPAETAAAILGSIKNSRKKGEKYGLIAVEWFEKWSKIYAPPPRSQDEDAVSVSTNDSELRSKADDSSYVMVDRDNASEVVMSPMTAESNDDSASVKKSETGDMAVVSPQETQLSTDNNAYIDDDNKGERANTEAVEVIVGPIDNSNIAVVINEEPSLKPGLVEGNDYIAIREDYYSILFEFYGGGPTFIRSVVSASKITEQCELELYPIQLHLYVQHNEGLSTDTPPSKVVVQSGFITLEELHAWAVKELDVSVVRLWVRTVSKTDNQLFCSTRSTPLQLTKDITSVDSKGWKLLDNSNDVTLNEIAVENATEDNKHTLSLIVEVGSEVSKPGHTDTVKPIKPSINWPRNREFHEWRQYLRVGDRVDVKDDKWWESIVAEVKTNVPPSKRVRIHFRGWGAKFDKEYDVNDERIQPLYSMSTKWRHEISVGKLYDHCVISCGDRKWYPCKVCTLGYGEQSGYVTVCTKGFQSQAIQTSMLDTDSELLMPLYTHTNAKQCTAAVADLNSFQSTIPAAANGCLAVTTMEPAMTDDWMSSVTNRVNGMMTHRSSSSGTSAYHGAMNGRFEAGVVGLRNLGNTCFANSVMQCLNSFGPITDYFVSRAFVSDVNTSNSYGTGGTLANAYFTFLQNCWSGKNSVIDNKDIMRCVARKSPMFEGCAQHDAQEFYSLLVDLLHEDTNRIRNRPATYQLNRSLYPDSQQLAQAYRIQYLERNSSFIADRCTGQYQSMFECGNHKCKFVWYTYEVYNLLQLPIDRTYNRTSLTTLLDDVTRQHKLGPTECFRCEKCHHSNPPTTKVDLWSVPSLLVIQLKRFYFETSYFGTSRR
jgi:hypothetical protein